MPHQTYRTRRPLPPRRWPRARRRRHACFRLYLFRQPDVARAERRRLRKALKKEHRGAAKELRKDGRFLAKEKRMEQDAEQAELDERGRRANMFMQRLENDFRSGGQGGVPKRKKR